MGQTDPLKLVFMGTPDLAATVLSRVLEWPGGRVCAVYSQPDRPAGRGMKLKAPPVKELALARDIPVYQPQNFKGQEDVEILRGHEPDYLLVAAYGLILPDSVLSVPSVMPLNVHTSLLPRLRGAAPIQRAIINGDDETGVTIMRMERGLDTGPIVLQQPVPILPDDTAGSLHDTLAAVGGDLLVKALEGLEDGSLRPVAQDESLATYAPKLTKAEGLVDFRCPATAVDALVRGLTPWPGATAVLERPGQDPLAVGLLNGKDLGENEITGSLPDACVPGGIAGSAVGIVPVRCGQGTYGLKTLKPAGRKAMSADAFSNGYLRGFSGARFRLPEDS